MDALFFIFGIIAVVLACAWGTYGDMRTVGAGFAIFAGLCMVASAICRAGEKIAERLDGGETEEEEEQGK